VVAAQPFLVAFSHPVVDQSLAIVPRYLPAALGGNAMKHRYPDDGLRMRIEAIRPLGPYVPLYGLQPCQ